MTANTKLATEHRATESAKDADREEQGNVDKLCSLTTTVSDIVMKRKSKVVMKEEVDDEIDKLDQISLKVATFRMIDLHVAWLATRAQFDDRSSSTTNHTGASFELPI